MIVSYFSIAVVGSKVNSGKKRNTMRQMKERFVMKAERRF